MQTLQSHVRLAPGTRRSDEPFADGLPCDEVEDERDGFTEYQENEPGLAPVSPATVAWPMAPARARTGMT